MQFYVTRDTCQVQSVSTHGNTCTISATFLTFYVHFVQLSAGSR